MKRLLVSASFCVCIALGILSTACSGPNGGQLLPASGPAKNISAGAGAGVPSGVPQPTLAPGQNDCVKLTPGSVSNGVITNVNGKLSAANVSMSFTATSCDARPESIGFQYTVSTGVGTSVTDCGNVTTPVPAGSVALGGNGGKSFTIVVPVPNCPNVTRIYAVNVTAFVPDGITPGQVLTTIGSSFKETDLSPNSPGVQNNVLHLSGTFVPDPATNPLPAATNGVATNFPVTYALVLNSFATLNWGIATGYQNGFVAAYLNGTFWGYGNIGIENLDFGNPSRTADLSTDLNPYLQPCDATQGPVLCGLSYEAFNTQTELHAGDKIEFFTVANDPNSRLLAPLLAPANGVFATTPVGPRLGSAIMQLVAN
jgi:hypothetical protein